jgi:hypothetical protein
VLVKHYLVLKSFIKNEVLQAVNKLRLEIEI